MSNTAEQNLNELKIGDRLTIKGHCANGADYSLTAYVRNVTERAVIVCKTKTDKGAFHETRLRVKDHTSGLTVETMYAKTERTLCRLGYFVA